MFRRLAVLDGPVGLALVRQVVAGGPIAEVRVVRILRALTARGLLTVDRSGPRWRYQQDDDLHRYARELLVDGGEQRAAFDRLTDAVREVLPEDARAPRRRRFRTKSRRCSVRFGRCSGPPSTVAPMPASAWSSPSVTPLLRGVERCGRPILAGAAARR